MDNLVLCAASAYEKKFYLNDEFDNLPQSIKDDLKILCVLFTEDVGGILSLEFDEDGYLQFKVECDPEDYLYDDIGSELKIKQLQRDKKELFEALEMYYKVFYLGEEVEE